MVSLRGWLAIAGFAAVTAGVGRVVVAEGWRVGYGALLIAAVLLVLAGSLVWVTGRHESQCPECGESSDGEGHRWRFGRYWCYVDADE